MLYKVCVDVKRQLICYLCSRGLADGRLGILVTNDVHIYIPLHKNREDPRVRAANANTIDLGRNFPRCFGQSYRGTYLRIYESKRLYQFLIYSPLVGMKLSI